MPLMSQRAYARHRAERGLPGTTHRAVQKAVQAGRIQVDAKGLIDSDAADRQWAANSSEGHRRNILQEEAAKAKAGPPAKAKGKAPAPPPVAPTLARALASASRPPPAPPPELEDPATATPGMSLADASALEKVWKAKLAELEFDERSGKLVPAEEVQARWVELVTISKTKLLALPAKCKARIPRLTGAEVGILDELIREALAELATAGDENG